MAGIFCGELQDYEGNIIYAQTEEDLVWLKDGSSLGNFLREETDAEIDIMIDAILSN